MGPRLCSRGDHAGPAAARGAAALQWGRGFVAAETTRTAKTTTLKHSCFNGAAAL